MAEDLGITNIALGIGQFGDGLLQILFFLIPVAVLCVLAFVVWYILQFKHKFRIREVVQGRKIIVDDKAREYKTRDGLIIWKLLKTRDTVPVPPPECIEIDKKGKKCVEAYKTETGEYVYGKDIAEVMDPPEELLQEKDEKKRNKLLTEWRKQNNVIPSFQPFTTPQRNMLINQMVKAQERKKRSLVDLIVPITSLGMAFMVVVLLIVMYGDIAKPLLEAIDKYNQNAKLQFETVEILKEMKLNIQNIKNDEIPKERPPD